MAKLKTEIAKIKQILTINKYPSKIVSNAIQTYFKKKQTHKTKSDTLNDVTKKQVFLVLPYYRGADDVKNQLKYYVQKCFPSVDFRFALKSPSTLSRSFSFKDKIENKMKSKIVYKINCCDCDKLAKQRDNSCSD